MAEGYPSAAELRLAYEVIDRVLLTSSDLDYAAWTETRRELADRVLRAETRA